MLSALGMEVHAALNEALVGVLVAGPSVRPLIQGVIDGLTREVTINGVVWEAFCEKWDLSPDGDITVQWNFRAKAPVNHIHLAITFVDLIDMPFPDRWVERSDPWKT